MRGGGRNNDKKKIKQKHKREIPCKCERKRDGTEELGCGG